MNKEKLKAAINRLRAEASRGPVPSSVVFVLTDPIMDDLERKPLAHSCCHFPINGPHNSSCAFYGEGE